MTAAVVFPGQGSQSVGMQAELADDFPVVRETYQEAGDALSMDLWGLVQNGPAEELDSTRNTQPALLAAGIAAWRIVVGESGQSAKVMAGHSLGEYTALCAAGAIGFADAVRLVAARGQFMQQAVPAGSGAMAVILGLDDDAVREVCREAAAGDVVQAVNFNAPGQVAIAGNSAAVERAMERAREAGARRALPLSVSVPSHCELMRPAAEKLAGALADVAIAEPSVPVINNVDVARESSPVAIRDALIRQLYNPVRWVETVEAIVATPVDAIVECGPGNVLTGLAKRIDRSVPGCTTATADAIASASAHF